MELTSVETVCAQLARSRLLSADEVLALRQRWFAEAGESAFDLDRFAQWLVANQYVTDYQARMLLRGHADHFFLNDYKVLDRAGKGRMAGVYKAVHRVGQVVAIKVLPRSRASDAITFARFQREARLAVQLNHPNVVRTFHVGQDGNLNYLVMEYLDGETLEEVLQRRGCLPPDEAVRIVYQALWGLQDIHEQGMVNRDLGPDNLMLVPAPAPGEPDTTLGATVKILDIGLGRALFDDGTAGSTRPVVLTSTGDVLGAPDYLAPEQARDARAADVRADIYSLGCVLYHALAGQPPFPDANLVRQMVRHATEAPRPVRDFNPTVPDELQDIVSRMMAKDAAQRYPLPEVAAKELQGFLDSRQKAQPPLEPEARIDAFRQWLKDDEQEDGDALAADPAAGSAARIAPSAARAAAVAGPVNPSPRERAPAGPPRAPKIAGRHRANAQQAPTMARTGAPAGAFARPVVARPPAAAVPHPSAGLRRTVGLSRRDWICLLAGAAGTLAAEAIGWFVAQWLGRG
jgi:serine/threonine protein kinase